MNVVINGDEYIKKPKPAKLDISKNIVANNDLEAAKLYYAFEPLCPECGQRAFPTNFPPESFGGSKSDTRTVWFCSEMGHCAFSIDKTIKWQEKQPKDRRERK